MIHNIWVEHNIDTNIHIIMSILYIIIYRHYYTLFITIFIYYVLLYIISLHCYISTLYRRHETHYESTVYIFITEYTEHHSRLIGNSVLINSNVAQGQIQNPQGVSLPLQQKDRRSQRGDQENN